MDKYEELLKKFFKETDFLGHSTGYEARTVLEFAQWLDNQSTQQSVQRIGGTCPVHNEPVSNLIYYACGCAYPANR